LRFSVHTFLAVFLYIEAGDNFLRHKKLLTKEQSVEECYATEA